MEQEYEDVQDEYQGKEYTINPGVGIGWYQNTEFDGVDTRPLFDDNVFHSVPKI